MGPYSTQTCIYLCKPEGVDIAVTKWGGGGVPWEQQPLHPINVNWHVKACHVVISETPDSHAYFHGSPNDLPTACSGSCCILVGTP